MRWKVKVQKACQPGKSTPNRAMAKAAFEAGESGALATLGRLLARYESRFYTPWKGTAAMMADLYHCLWLMINRDGEELINASIDVLFTSRDLRWVKSPTVALVNKDFFYKFIVPVAHQEMAKVRGEQAEWREKSSPTGCQQVQL